MRNERSQARPRPIRESLQEYGRGVAGGLLFSVPLLYTMEVWERGFTVHPGNLLLYLLVSYVVLLGYNRYGGMHRDARLSEVAVESVEEMGLGLLIAAGVLYLTGRITLAMPWGEVLGKTVIESMTVAIGVSVGTAQLGGGGQEQPPGQPQPGQAADEDARANGPELPDPWGQLVLSFCGALLIASNVAPTEEIVVIGLETTPVKLLGLAAVSLAVCALVLNYSGFVGADRHVRRDAKVWIVYGVISSYAAALAASALLLWFFGRFDGMSPAAMVAQTVVLGLPAALGASAARLLIQ